MEQVLALFYALTVGADILYVRSRNPRVIFEAIRDHRVTTMLVGPQVLDLFWSAVEREVRGRPVANFNRLRTIARRLPYRAGGSSSDGPPATRRRAQPVRLPPPRSCRRRSSRRGRTSASSSMQGYGATECGSPRDDQGRPRPRAPSAGRSGRSRCAWPTTARSR